MGQSLPQIEAETLSGTKLSLPSGLSADHTVLVLSFQRDHQEVSNAWRPHLAEMAKSGSVTWYELAFLDVSTPVRLAVGTAMDYGITDAVARKHVAPVWSSHAGVRKALGITSDQEVVVAVVNKSGAMNIQGVRFTERRFGQGHQGRAEVAKRCSLSSCSPAVRSSRRRLPHRRRQRFPLRNALPPAVKPVLDTLPYEVTELEATPDGWEVDTFGMTSKQVFRLRATAELPDWPGAHLRYVVVEEGFASAAQAAARLERILEAPPGLSPEEAKAFPMRKGLRLGDQTVVVVSTDVRAFEFALEREVLTPLRERLVAP